MTAQPTTPGRLALSRAHGYVLLMLLLFLTVMSIGLMVAVPIWQTQIKREKEEELIFRGKQYVEAVRLYQLKHPGRFPAKPEDLVGEKCLRRLWRDPMTAHGQWNFILLDTGGGGQAKQGRRAIQPVLAPSPTRRQGQGERQAFSPQKVLIVPPSALTTIQNPQILGVVSPSQEKSIRIYNGEDSYDKWLFYYGQDPQKNPEIVHYGQSPKAP